MIVTDLAHVTEQACMSPVMLKALAFLHNLQGRDLVDGILDTGEERLYAVVASYHTGPPAGRLSLEVHHSHIDIDYVMSGREVIAWAPDAWLHKTVAYDRRQDAWYGTLAEDRASRICLFAGEVSIMYPGDGHKARLPAGEPGHVRKLFIKIALNE
jgi:biofilm protein TabA